MKNKRLAILIIILIFLFSVFFYNTLYMNIHENLHCLGAKLIKHNCYILLNESVITPKIQEGEILNSLISTGAPYLFALFVLFILFIFRRKVIDYLFPVTLFLIFLTFIQILINFISINDKNNDFKNIITTGGIIGVIIYSIIILFSLYMICINLKYYISKFVKWNESKNNKKIERL